MSTHTFRRLTPLAMLACTCLLAMSLSARAAVQIDQTTVAPDHPNSLPVTVGQAIGFPGEPNRQYEAAQSLTAGLSGYLYQVDVWVGRQDDVSGDLLLSIGDANFIDLASTPLASFSIHASDVQSADIWTPALVSINVRAANIHFNMGDSFFVALTAPTALPSAGVNALSPYTWAADSREAMLAA